MALKCYWKLALVAGGAVFAMSAQAGETISYTYDVHGRVTGAAHSGTVNNGVSTTYAHDKADNRTNVTVAGATSLLAAPESLETTTSPDAQSPSGDPSLAATSASEMQSEPVPTDPLPGPS